LTTVYALDWRPCPGRPRDTWLRTLEVEADLQPLNHGLNSAWRHAQYRGRWKQLAEKATHQSGAHPWWWWWWWWWTGDACPGPLGTCLGVGSEANARWEGNMGVATS